jgi:uncharacterized membrane protein
LAITIFKPRARSEKLVTNSRNLYNEMNMEAVTRHDRLKTFNIIFKTLLIVLTGVALTAWWVWTPQGVLGKADAAGYAVCHRIDTRSFFAGDRQMPLCARCSGMYLGALMGTVYLGTMGKRAGMPPRKVMAVLAAFVLLFGIDGANSFLHFFPGVTGLYEPQNWLRLITGTGVGLGIAAVLVPVVNGTLWQTYDARASLPGLMALVPLLALAGLLDLALLSGLPFLLYPLALLSGAGVFLILSMVYGMVWLMLTRRENTARTWQQVWTPWLAGFLTALVQVGAFDAARLWLTGTWGGFPL